MLRFCDGFDHYAVGSRLLKWTGNDGNGVNAAFPSGRTGTAMHVNTQTGGQGIYKQLDFQAEWVVGVAVMFLSVGSAWEWMYLSNNGSFGTRNIAVGFSANRLYVDSGFGSATGTTEIVEDVWYYVELKVVHHNTTGSYELRINGQTELSGTNVDTLDQAVSTSNRLHFHSSTGPNFKIDDLYWCDTTGGVNDDFLGDITVETLVPTGNGNSSQFDGSDGNSTDNYLLVDEATPDGDTTYVESAVIAEKDTYAYEDLATANGTVYAVSPVPYFRKTTAGTVVANSIARLGVTEEDSADKMVLDSYTFSPDYRATKPGGGAWTIADVNSAEFGMKVA